jgi:hypothetical protein
LVKKEIRYESGDETGLFWNSNNHHLS